jgi:2,3-bisphosphoglycerate-independent phosphoglycerate mutase
MVLPDHPTPLSLRTHTNDAVPFAVCTSGRLALNRARPGNNGNSNGLAGSSACSGYDEAQAAASRIYVADGHSLMGMFLSGSGACSMLNDKELP